MSDPSVEISPTRKKRKSIKTQRFEQDFHENSEQRQIQEAIRLSKKDNKRHQIDIPEAPTYYPSVAEFENPIAYIESIRDEASQYGICKVIPPTGWEPKCTVDVNSSTMIFPTRKQQIDTLQQGQSFDDGNSYNLRSFKEMGDKFSREWIRTHYKPSTTHNNYGNESNVAGTVGCDASAAFNPGPINLSKDETCANTSTEIVNSEIRQEDVSSMPCVESIDVVKNNNCDNEESSRDDLSFSEVFGDHACPVTQADLIKDYWNIVETGQFKVCVEYANDLDTTSYMSGFPINTEEEPVKAEIFTDNWYRTCGWNLNNLASAKGSLLKYLKTPINGVNVPWIYFGMLFSTFCWHNEDNYMPSINYHHFGANKVWYGVSGAFATQFEKIAKEFLHESFRQNPDLLYHITTQISPSLLRANGVPVYTLSQTPGSFILTFPKAYHGGFSTGFNCTEAVNFATADWLSFGSDAEEKYRSFARPSVFSFVRLLFTLSNYVKELAPKYRPDLAREIKRIVDEELIARPKICKAGIRDLSMQAGLAPNSFTIIDQHAADYDDLRVCHICNHFCIFTAVGCECSHSKVVCIRHYQSLCSCPMSKKYMLAWMSTEKLSKMQHKARIALIAAGKLASEAATIG